MKKNLTGKLYGNVEDAVAFEISFIPIVYGYDNILDTEHYVKKLCSTCGNWEQDKDFMAPKKYFKGEHGEITFGPVVNEEIKEELINNFDITEDDFRKVTTKTGDIVCYQIAPKHVLKPIAPVNRFKKLKPCPACGLSCYRDYTYENKNGEAYYYINQEAMDDLHDFNITVEKFSRHFQMFIASKRVFEFLSSKYPRMRFKPFYLKNEIIDYDKLDIPPYKSSGTPLDEIREVIYNWDPAGIRGYDLRDYDAACDLIFYDFGEGCLSQKRDQHYEEFKIDFRNFEAPIEEWYGIVAEIEKRLNNLDWRKAIETVEENRLVQLDKISDNIPRMPMSAVFYKNGEALSVDISDKRLIKLLNFFNDHSFWDMFSYSGKEPCNKLFKSIAKEDNRLEITYKECTDSMEWSFDMQMDTLIVHGNTFVGKMSKPSGSDDFTAYKKLLVCPCNDDLLQLFGF